MACPHCNRDWLVVEPPSVRYIMAVVAARHGLSVEQILSAQRARRIAKPRQFAMWLTRHLRPDLSYPQIAKLFKRDHTTIMHGVRCVEDAVGDTEAPGEVWCRLLAASRV